MKRAVCFILAVLLLLTAAGCGMLGGNDWFTVKEKDGSVSLGDSRDKVMKRLPGGEVQEGKYFNGYVFDETKNVFRFRTDETGKEKLVLFITYTGSVNGIGIGDSYQKVLRKTGLPQEELSVRYLTGEEPVKNDSLVFYVDKKGNLFTRQAFSQMGKNDPQVDLTEYIYYSFDVRNEKIARITVGDHMSVFMNK